VSALVLAFGKLRRVSEPEPDPESEATVGDALAARLLAAQRVLASLDASSDARIRLSLRFMAICTSLKLPGASRASCTRRLDRLLADAGQVQAGRAPTFDQAGPR
jgi:hypothetical protein